MKTLLAAGLLLASVVMALAGDVIELDLDDFDHSQDGLAGRAVTGEYKWESPEGDEYVVRYIADERGFRVLDSNAVPATAAGVRADGAQGDLDGDSNEDDE